MTALLQAAPIPTPQATNPLKQAALHYAALGWPVFPCKPCGKEPLTRHGCHEATRNAAQIRRWWKKWPDANVAIATTGLVVLDTDGPEGEAAIAGRDLPPAPTAYTGKGIHRFYTDTTGAGKCKVGVLPQVDIRAAGGYVIAPPSVHPSGAVYTWAPGLSPDDLPSPPAPQHLCDLAAPRGDLPPPQGDTPAPIPRGERNTTLTRIAGSLRADGQELAAITAGLLEANKSRCTPPLPEGEVRRIAASVMRYPAGATGPTVRVARALLLAGLTAGALTLYATRQALTQATGTAPKQAALAEALGVTTRRVRTWASELKAAGLGAYERPTRRFVACPVGLLTDPQVSHEAKATALWLLTFSDADGAAAVGLAALAQATRQSESTTKRHLRELRKGGHLQARVAPFSPELGRRERCNLYRFLATTPPVAVALTPQKRNETSCTEVAAIQKRNEVAPESRPLAEPLLVAVSPQALKGLSKQAVCVNAPDLRSAIVETTAQAAPEHSVDAPAQALSDQAVAEPLAAALELQRLRILTRPQGYGQAQVLASLRPPKRRGIA